MISNVSQRLVNNRRPTANTTASVEQQQPEKASTVASLVPRVNAGVLKAVTTAATLAALAKPAKADYCYESGDYIECDALSPMAKIGIGAGVIGVVLIGGLAVACMGGCRWCCRGRNAETITPDVEMGAGRPQPGQPPQAAPAPQAGPQYYGEQTQYHYPQHPTAPPF